MEENTHSKYGGLLNLLLYHKYTTQMLLTGELHCCVYIEEIPRSTLELQVEAKCFEGTSVGYAQAVLSYLEAKCFAMS